MARDLIDEAGLGDFFGHSLGHGVGLDVHEDPRLSSGYDRPLEEGNVVTVEPGIYLPARGRRADRGPRGPDPRGRRGARRPADGLDHRGLSSPSSRVGRSADTRGDGTPNPHPPAAPRRHDGRAGRAGRPRHGRGCAEQAKTKVKAPRRHLRPAAGRRRRRVARPPRHATSSAARRRTPWSSSATARAPSSPRPSTAPASCSRSRCRPRQEFMTPRAVPAPTRFRVRAADVRQAFTAGRCLPWSPRRPAKPECPSTRA